MSNDDKKTSRPIRVPQRTCVGCRSVKAKRTLYRIIVDDAQMLSIDPTGKANGRGAYLCSSKCLSLARKHHAFERQFGSHLTYDVLATQLAEIEKQTQ